MFARAVVVACLAVGLSGCFDYSDGNRVGTVIKFSRKGYICKTWEGQMFLGGLKKQTSTTSDGATSTNMVANTWDFTVENPALVPLVAKAMEDGTPVRLSYRQEAATFCRSDSDGNYFVTAISTNNHAAPEVPSK